MLNIFLDIDRALGRLLQIFIHPDRFIKYSVQMKTKVKEIYFELSYKRLKNSISQSRSTFYPKYLLTITSVKCKMLLKNLLTILINQMQTKESPS